MQRSLAVVAYPELGESDRDWIESFRRHHDPQASRIAAHFTLFFPADVAAETLDATIAAAVRLARPVSFSISRADASTDAVTHRNHVVLVPGEGAAEITDLHDRLYSGSLRAHLRPDIAFIPHITVGTVSDPLESEQLLQTLNARSPILRGRLTEIDLVDVSRWRVATLARYRLGGVRSDLLP
jgi:2'-5' RNA ligase